MRFCVCVQNNCRNNTKVKINTKKAGMKKDYKKRKRGNQSKGLESSSKQRRSTSEIDYYKHSIKMKVVMIDSGLGRSVSQTYTLETLVAYHVSLFQRTLEWAGWCKK